MKICKDIEMKNKNIKQKVVTAKYSYPLKFRKVNSSILDGKKYYENVIECNDETNALRKILLSSRANRRRKI